MHYYDCRLFQRDVARIVIYPFYLVIWTMAIIFGFILSPFMCLFYGVKKTTWISTDEDLTAFAYPIETPTGRFDIRQVTYTTFFHTTKDGTRLAVDVWLPKGVKESGAKVGCVLHQARYYRSFKLWCPGSWFRRQRPINFINDLYFQSFLSKGLALVSYDIRGAGASFGKNEGPWLPRETEDSLEVIDWIIQQPWSNGSIGLFGMSYEGTAALLTGITGHPAIKALSPNYIFLDIYADVGFVGGIHLHGFIQQWERITRCLDGNNLSRLQPLAWFSVDGVQPVLSAPLSDLRAAVEGHKDNWSSTKDGRAVSYVDDPSDYNHLRPKDISPYVRIDAWIAKLREGKEAGGSKMHVPDFLMISGWFDTTASCAIKFAYHVQGLAEVKLVIGPWSHGGMQHGRFFPGASTSFTKYNAPEKVARYLQAHLSCPPSTSSASTAAATTTAALSKTKIGATSNGSPTKEGGGEDRGYVSVGVREEGEAGGNGGSGSGAGPSTTAAVYGTGEPRTRHFTMHEEKWKIPKDGIFPCPSSSCFHTLHLDCSSHPPQVSSSDRRRRRKRALPKPGGSLLLQENKDSSSSPSAAAPVLPTEESQLSLPVHIHKARASKGVSRYLAMTKVYLPMAYDMDDPKIKHLHFTSPPLTDPMEITGFPIVRLHVSSSTSDASLFVYLLCVDADGNSHYITEGCLRVSSRKLVSINDEEEKEKDCINKEKEKKGLSRSTSVTTYPNVPSHSFHRSDAQPLLSGGSPVEVCIALQPTSYLFRVGQCIRLSIGGADPIDYLPLDFDDHALCYTLTVHTGPQYPSFLKLPFVIETPIHPEGGEGMEEVVVAIEEGD